MNSPENTETAYKTGDLVELTVADLAVDGGGVAKESGVVFFLDKGIPGDKVEARVHTAKKRLMQARVERVLVPSENTATPFCKHFGKCGGCTWQNLSYEAQLDWKSRHVKETLTRLGGVKNPEGLKALENLKVIASPKRSAYRNKVEYVFSSNQGAGTVLGLRRRSSQLVEEIEACPLQSEKAGTILGTVREWAKKHKLEAWDGKNGHLRFLVIREPEAEIDGKEQRSVELISSSKFADSATARTQTHELEKSLEAFGVSTFMHSVRFDKNNIAYGEKVIFSHGEYMLQENFGTQNIVKLSVPVNGFMQTNTGAAGLLCESARAMVSTALGAGKNYSMIWDLYSGSGLFAFYLANLSEKVLGFEQDKNAVRAARQNAKDLGVTNCGFYDGDAYEKAKQAQSKPDLIVLDPPRAGLTPELCTLLKQKKSAHILYVSCAPATLARDIAILAPDYNLIAASAVDMFPHNPHVETIVLLSRLVPQKM